VDAYEAISQATLYLISKGKKNIKYIGAVKESVISKEKEKGFYDAMKSAGYNVDPSNIYHGERQHFSTGVNGVEYFLAQNDIPDGIVCSTDDVGIGCIKQLTKRGIRVPEQTCVIGFNGISILNSYEPELTTVAQPIKEIADSAVYFLLNRMNDRDLKKQRINYKGTIKEGGNINQAV
jgi:DNA-binding LacI/PurR family transcriptional regulator